VPNITPGGSAGRGGDRGDARDGFTPEFDVVGGEMAEVVRNTSQLSDEDRAAIAAYLKAVPASRTGRELGRGGRTLPSCAEGVAPPRLSGWRAPIRGASTLD
jgi:hypothetical protein